MPAADVEPQIALSQVSAARAELAEYWHVGWKVENRGEHPIKILAARLPHGQFKSEEVIFGPSMELSPGKSEGFQVSVRCHEPAGLVTENAFVIFQVTWLGEPWRVFVRVRVSASSEGQPSATTESVTTQKVGFSGVTS